MFLSDLSIKRPVLITCVMLALLVLGLFSLRNLGIDQFPKVDIPTGQEVSFIDPEYATGRWVGLKGVVEGNPFYEICRSQQDVRVLGNWKKLLSEVRDSHWVMVYGDFLKEIGYAAPRVGVTWDNISET